MGTIPNPPLIEAIFELRWGQTAPGQFKFTQDESDFFPGIFYQSIKQKGFVHSDPIASGVDQFALPFYAKHRFRKAAGKWPCFQIGLGVFTANQIGKMGREDSYNSPAYDWDDFREVIKIGIDSLISSYPSGTAGFTKPTVILRYQDGFYLEDNLIDSYVNTHFQEKIKLGKFFSDLKSSNVNENLENINLTFVYDTNKPKGKVNISVVSGSIGSKPSIVVETSVVSDLNSSQIGVDYLMSWCEQAHDLQRDCFNSLIRGSDQ